MVDAGIIISQKIYIIRGVKVMLDFDLAELYGTETKRLNQAIKRNIFRFPPDFAFYLTDEEEGNLKSQFVTSSSMANYGGKRKKTRVFTELGIAMLSSVLNTEIAIQVNIQIMRTFQKLREMLISNQDLKRRLEEMEREYEGNFKVIFETLRHMFEEEQKPKEPIGFRLG